MTMEMWMGLGVIVALIGFVLYRVGLSMIHKGNKNGGMFTTIAWLFIIVGVMTAFSFFRAKYLS